MGSKAIMFLGLLLAMFLLISTEVAARELVEETSKVTEAEPDQYGGGGGRYGRPRYCRRRCCTRYGCRCCYPGEAVDPDFNEAETHN